MSIKATTQFSCILHGSFGQHYNEIRQVHKLFSQNGIKVLAPSREDIVAIKKGFLLLEGEQKLDPRVVELQYLHNLRKLGVNGFSYFVNPGGYVGKSASYELGIAQMANVACFFNEKPKDLPVYYPKNAVIRPEELISYIKDNNTLPLPRIHPIEKTIHKLLTQLIMPGSIVAAGGIIEYNDSRKRKLPEVLMVKTHKWGNRYSIVGGKVRTNERLIDTLVREIKEETNLNASVEKHICTFDQIKNSGYYTPSIHHIFVDYVARVSSKKVKLNEEAQDYIWVPAEQALAELNIEPNAKHTLELYAKLG